MRGKEVDDFMNKTLSNKQYSVWYYSGTITARVLYTGDTENMAAQGKMLATSASSFFRFLN